MLVVLYIVYLHFKMLFLIKLTNFLCVKRTKQNTKLWLQYNVFDRSWTGSRRRPQQVWSQTPERRLWKEKEPYKRSCPSQETAHAVIVASQSPNGPALTWESRCVSSVLESTGIQTSKHTHNSSGYRPVCASVSQVLITWWCSYSKVVYRNFYLKQ